MKKIKILIVTFALAALILPNFTMAAPMIPLNAYFFWGEGCPHCAEEEKFLEKIKEDYPRLVIKDYEVWYDQDNIKLLKKINQDLNINISGVPVIIIGDKPIIGFLNAQTTGKQIKQRIEQCLERTCDDKTGQIISELQQQETPPEPEPAPDPDNNEPEQEEYLIHLPIIGEIDVKKYSLPLLTIIIAGFDGFNPCAMWVLVFLISLLLGMENKKRMWILGSTFIFTSGLVYFLFLSAWLNLFLFIGFIIWVRIIIGLVAIGSGVYHLKEFFTNKDASCKVVKAEKRTKIMDRLKAVTSAQKFYLALGGIILVAFAVNLVELVCSAGLPAIYTNILSLSNLPPLQYYSYLILYIIIFMFDDMLVFIIAMVTLQATGLATRYVRYANLIGGIIILILGILLIIRPEWLMFS